MIAIEKCPLLFVDVEAGGLDVGYHEILELAWILTDPSGEQILTSASSKVKPTHPDRITPEAAAINGYSESGWAEALPLKGVLAEMCSKATSAIFVAHNVAYDFAMVQAAIGSCNLRWPGRYHRADTVALAWPLLHSGRVPDTKLRTLVRYFGLEQSEAHRAGSDVHDCRRLYLRLMQPWEGLLDRLPYGETSLGEYCA